MWAGLNLTEDDLPQSQAGNFYPLELVRAVTLAWLFSGQRSDEIARLRIGCIRWQHDGTAITGDSDQVLARDAVCLLDVPAHKTGTAFTKPVDPVLGQALDAWQAVRPAQPKFTDRRTGELVDLLFAFRARKVSTSYINNTVIPVLCRKAGVPAADVRGKITSHRARSTIASQLYNAKEPMTLFELQAWLGHRSPQSTQFYAKISPATLTRAYDDAGYFARNVRTIEVLVDRDAVASGAAAAGEPWQHYDLGHGYCTYTFFEQCPHRMACAKCDFYTPKGSGRAQILEAKENLQKMRAMIPLTDDEQAAVDDGDAALEPAAGPARRHPHAGRADAPATRSASPRDQPADHRCPADPAADLTGLDLTILIPQNGPVDVALDDAGVPGHGQAVEHGVVVAFDAADEGVQVRLVIGLDGGDPVIEPVSVEAGEDLGELGDVAGEGVQVRAAFPGLRELGLLLVIEVGRVGEDPAGQVTGLRRAGDGGRGGAGLAERQHVVADGAVPAFVSAFFELGVQLADVGDAVVPPLVQVGLVLIEDRRAAVPDLGEQLVHGGCAVEAADGLFGQAGLPHDRLDALAAGFQRLDLLVPLPGADCQGGILRAPGGGLDRGLLRVRGLRGIRDDGVLRFIGGGFFQAAAVPGHRFARVLAQVVPDMPPVGDLDRLRGALACAVGVGAGPVPADDLGPGMFLQPVGEGFGFAVAQQVNGPSGLDVDQDGAVVAAPAEREVIHAQDGHGAGSGVGLRDDQPQQAGPAGRQVQGGGQPRSGAAGQGQRNRGQRACQRRGPPGTPGGQAIDLLGEGDRWTVRVAAKEPADPEPDPHPPSADRGVGQPTAVGAVHLAGRIPAPRAASTVSASAGQEPHAVPDDLGFLHDHGDQVRQQHLETDPVLA